MDRKIYTVSELTAAIKALLEGEIGGVWVEGELSNVRRPSSGHCYFTLKDEAAQITAVLFRGNQRDVRFEVADGLKVRLFGDLTVYARGGNYQIVARSIEDAGKGSLQRRFEELKAKLQSEGLFDAARKRPIPVLPRHVGVVTSPSGAAIRDIMSVTARRFPNLHILLAPVRVQGEGAAAEIAAAIDAINARGGLDVLIVGRGGGSIEDLWCFNEEIVARAIARSRVPVISAVGHETDFTISDFVADLRAPTPSAAAELVVGRKDAFEKELADTSRRLASALRSAWLAAARRLEAVRNADVFREPANIARIGRERLEGLGLRMRHSLVGSLRDSRQTLDESAIRAAHSMKMGRRSAAERLERARIRMEALNPLAVLGRGYSITMSAKGRAVRSGAEIAPGDAIRTIFAEGSAESTVVRTSKAAIGK